MTRILLYVSAAISSFLLMIGYLLAGQFSLGIVFFGIDILWIFGLTRRWDWVSAAGLCVVLGGAAWGIYLGVMPVLPFFAVIFSLLAWDLEHFAARLRLASSEDDIAGMERRHLLRLAAVAGIGGGLSVVALMMRVKTAFELMVVLVFLGVWGIGRVVGWLLTKE
jgi:hypothetical protein